MIAAKVEDLRANGYPGCARHPGGRRRGSRDRCGRASGPGARALTGPERLGKSQALNRGFAEADDADRRHQRRQQPPGPGRAGRRRRALRRPRGRCRGRREGRGRRRRGREHLLAVRVLAQATRGPTGYDHRPGRRARPPSGPRRGARFRPTSPPTISGPLSTSLSRGTGSPTSRGPVRSIPPPTSLAVSVGAPDPQRVRRAARHVPAAPASSARRPASSRPSCGGTAWPVTRSAPWPTWRCW